MYHPQVMLLVWISLTLLPFVSIITFGRSS